VNANSVTKSYSLLTPEERFSLILAADGRGDEAERDRLAHSGGRILLSMQDHAPYAQAFDQLAWFTFIELLEEAARYMDAMARNQDHCEFCAAVGDDDGETPDQPRGEQRDRPLWQRSLDLALAAGYTLRAKADGWKLFCERIKAPAFLVWRGFPGDDRLQRALALAEEAAFTAEGFLCWLNRIRPGGEPEATQVPLTAAGVADATEAAYRTVIQWLSGKRT
jgi:hypothetical protein